MIFQLFDGFVWEWKIDSLYNNQHGENIVY